MAMMVPTVQLCAKCFRKRGLIATAFEAEGGYEDVFWRKTRFDKMLPSMSRLCHRAKHKYAEKLLAETAKYETSSTSNQSKLHKKMYVLMKYDDVHDLEKKAGTREYPWNVVAALDDFEVIMACQRFPSITLGSSSFLELYDDSACSSNTRSDFAAQTFENLFPNQAVEKSDKPPELQTWPSLSGLPSIISSDAKDESSTSQVQFCSGGEDKKAESSHGFNSEDFSSYVIEKIPKTVEIDLDSSVSFIPGVSKKQCRQLEECGFHTVRKLLQHFPRTYADVQNPHTGIVDGQYLIFVGRVLSSKGVRASYSFSFVEVVVSGEIMSHRSPQETDFTDAEKSGKRTIYLHLKKYFRGARFTNQSFLRSIQQKNKEGDFVCVSGKVRSMTAENHYEMREYSLDVIEDGSNPSACAERRPYPIYPSKGGLKPMFLRDIIRRTLQSLPSYVDPIPQDIIGEFSLLHLHNAYAAIHQPKDLIEADLARKRFIFDEFFYLQLGRLYQMLEGLGSCIEKEGLLEKYQNPIQNAVFTEDWSTLAKTFLQSLPYKLTSSQLTAVSEIIWDLKRPLPMNRLLQGDVGCGKTVVAFLACMEVIGSGYQAAFMVPTELLAIQHYGHLQNLLDNMDFDGKPSIALLTGSTPTRQARLIRQGLQAGDISLVVGTHSLIAEKVEFSMLRLAVIDEQHRFGVIQRGLFSSKLFNKGSKAERDADSADDTSDLKHMAAHVLAMSATPIPRTLALALYGDMSLTHITELPPGRIPVETHILEGNDDGFERVYKMMLSELQSGGKVYLVYPVIELSEQLPQLRAASADLETISSKFPDYKCSLLHGRMKGDEKEDALRRFREGETPILLATQVIEIGVDVPDASMMVVMNAERFGIAQLHQLRGRVGRGSRQSRCVMLGSTSVGMNRLKVLENSSDGFHLANVDLLLRGPGDLLGKKQSGHLPEFPIARLEMDGNILQEAHVAALRTLSMSHDLELFPALKAELSMRQPLSLLGD